VFYTVTRQLRWGQLRGDNCAATIALLDNCAGDNCAWDNCAAGQLRGDNCAGRK
jgi:hypothetical protein